MKVKIDLSFPRELKDDPLICDICKKFDIILNILEASFTTEIGWALLIIEGEEADVNKSLQYLKDSGVEIQETHTLS